MKERVIIELDLSTFLTISTDNKQFGMFDFILLESLRQDREDAFQLIEKHPFSKRLIHSKLNYLESIGFIKIIDEEVEDSWWEKVDLKQAYLNLFPVKRKDDVEEWIELWRSKFPAGVRSGGYPVRGDKQGCIQKMRVFVKKYKYPKDVIFAATDKYIEAKEKERWAFMQLAHYFISKNGQSTLAMFCEEVVNKTKLNDEYEGYTVSV